MPLSLQSLQEREKQQQQQQQTTTKHNKNKNKKSLFCTFEVDFEEADSPGQQA